MIDIIIKLVTPLVKCSGFVDSLAVYCTGYDATSIHSQYLQGVLIQLLNGLIKRASSFHM